MAARSISTSRALLRASHPEPGFAVTTLAVLLAVSMEASARTAVLIGVAAFTGQLTVGWSNDLFDRDRDRLAGRRDKPLATGALRPTTVRAAIGVALAISAATSLALGAGPGVVHLGLVALGWAYNRWLKLTWASWLPYAVCFGLLPFVVSMATDHGAPPAWMPVAGALLGVGAHLVNVVPDLDDDARTGVHGLPHRLGARRSLDLATLLMIGGTVATVLGPGHGLDLAGALTLALVAVLALAGRLGRGHSAFRAALAIALVDVVALLVSS